MEKTPVIFNVSLCRELLRGLVIGFTFSTSLLGITFMQAYMYYRRYPHDSLSLKLLVAVLITLDTLTTALAAHGMHTYVVDDDLQPFNTVVWSLIAENYFCVITAVLTQLYFARRIWILSQNKLLTGATAILALISLTGGTWLSVKMFVAPDLATLESIGLRILTLLGSGCSSLCDILISAGLCYFFHTSRTGIKRSDALIDKLIGFTIQRGLITSFCQTYIFVTDVVSPNTFLYLPVTFMQNKTWYSSEIQSPVSTLRTLKQHEFIPAFQSIHIGANHYDEQPVLLRSEPAILEDQSAAKTAHSQFCVEG
ncbi:hypothetical protein ACG7TL_002182 [Trametes sanguinea]